MSSPSADAVNARIDSFGQGVVVSNAGATTSTAMAAGGTGDAAGAWDTSAHRDESIAAFNNLRIDFDTLHTKVNALLAVLRTNGLIPQ